MGDQSLVERPTHFTSSVEEVDKRLVSLLDQPMGSPSRGSVGEAVIAEAVLRLPRFAGARNLLGSLNFPKPSN